MQLCNNQGQWCNRPTDQSDSRGKKRAGTLPGIPVSIKGADLHLHLISDLFSRRQRISLQGLSVSATVSYGHTVSPLFLAFSLFLSLLLSFTPSFIFPFLYRLAAVGSSSYTSSKPCGLFHPPHSSLSSRISFFSFSLV